MKKIFLLLIILMMATNIVFALGQPNPKWANVLPIPPKNANYCYVLSIGTDKDIDKAEKLAKENLEKESFYATGRITYPEQSLNEGGIIAQLRANKEMTRKLACRESIELYEPQKRTQVFLLYQVQLDGRIDAGFEDCGCCLHEEYQKEKEKFERAVKRDSLIKKVQNLIGKSYIGISILDAGYPWNIGIGGVAARFGNEVFGIGFQFGILGVDIGGLELQNAGTYDRKHIANFRYYAGLKLFPYDNIFLAASYGRNGYERISAFNDNEGRFAINGWRQNEGWFFQMGYDWVSGDNINPDLFISFAPGIAYDNFMKEWNFMINLKLGLAINL